MGAKAFGAVIARERTARGYTQQQGFAAALRAQAADDYPGDALVGHWERGDRAPTLRGFHLISMFFGWDVVKRAEMEALLMGPEASAEPVAGEAA